MYNQGEYDRGLVNSLVLFLVLCSNNLGFFFSPLYLLGVFRV